jgi:hypothetical protein
MAIGDSKRNKREIASSRAREFVPRENGSQRMAMDDKKRETLSPAPHTLAKSKPGGAPNEEKELAEVCARFADLCQYFSQQSMDLPPQIVDEVRLVSKLEVKERIAKMKRLSQDLMEYFNDAGPDSQLRQ